MHVSFALDIFLASEAELQALQSCRHLFVASRRTEEVAEKRVLSKGCLLDRGLFLALSDNSQPGRDNRGNGPVKRKSPVKSSYLFRR